MAVQPGVLDCSREPLTGKISERGRDHRGVEALIRDPLNRGLVTLDRHDFAARRLRRLFENPQQARFIVNEKDSKSGPAHLPPQECSIKSHDNSNSNPVKPPPGNGPVSAGSVRRPALRNHQLDNTASKPDSLEMKPQGSFNKSYCQPRGPARKLLGSDDVQERGVLPMPAEKRRSDRLMLTVPLIVAGTDTQGKDFKQDARTVTLNRHGALIQISRPLLTGQRIRIVNALCHREAEFTVVGPVAPRSEKGGQWGVECLNTKVNMWGIQFPPPSDKPNEPSALLECRRCHTAELKRVSLIEVEVLETSGILNKACETCGIKTPWGYAESQLAMSAPPSETKMLAEVGIGRGAELRRHTRVSMQLPILVRDYYGGVEISKSENVSKGGFCFLSEKNYHVGAAIMVACPYNSAEQCIEIPARVVRRIEVPGTNGKTYGVRYEKLH